MFILILVLLEYSEHLPISSHWTIFDCWRYRKVYLGKMLPLLECLYNLKNCIYSQKLWELSQGNLNLLRFRHHILHLLQLFLPGFRFRSFFKDYIFGVVGNWGELVWNSGYCLRLNSPRIWNSSTNYSKVNPEIKNKCTWYRTFAFPRTIIPYFARVMVTFNLRGSFKNPIPGPSLDRTQETIM